MSTASRLIRPALGGAVVFSGYTLYAAQRPMLAESPAGGAATATTAVIRPGRTASGDKLPIYLQSDESIITLIESDNPIAPYVAQTRQSLSHVFSGASGYVQDGASKWISFERDVEKQVRTVLPKDESLTPGLIYVLIAGLTGSVISRTRAFPLRFLTPPLFALAAMPYFLPKTSHNLRSYLSDVEDRHFPDFAASHDQLNARLGMHWDMLTSRLGSAGEDARGWGQKAVQGIEKNTGLRVGDVVSRGKEKLEAEKERIKVKIPVTVDGTPALETVGYVVEQRPIAEIVRPVVEQSEDAGTRIV